MQFVFAKFPRRTLHIISGPTVVGPSQDQAGSVVRYEVKFVFNNGQKRLEGKAAVQLTVEIEGDELAITSIAPKILEHTP
jgi:hypothetical protein